MQLFIKINMKSDTQSIYNLFQSKRRYVVPLYQRHYVWSKENQWEPLWEDILSKTLDHLSQNESSPHFMGAMVFAQIPTYGKQLPAHTVIDGQQRLTTLQLFLAAFRNVVRKHNVVEYVDEISLHVLNNGMMDDKMLEHWKVEQFKVLPTKADQAQFCDVIVSESREQLEEKYPPEYERRKIKPRPTMVEAYLYFDQVLEDYLNDPDIVAETSDRVEALHLALKTDLQVVTIDLEPKDDPQVIFETLNARGEPLLPSDLLRNNIFRRAELNGENQELLYQRYWKTFEEEFWRVEEKQGRLKRARIDLFMQHFLALKKAADVNVGHLFEEYKGWVKSSNSYASVASELEDLVRYAGAFHQLTAQSNESVFGVFAQRLNVIDVRTIYPLLLFLLADSELSEEELAAAGRILESYLIRRAVCGKTTKNYNKSFLQIMRELQTNRVTVEALEDQLLEFTGEAGVFPDDEEFEKAWLANPVYEMLGPRKVELILHAIEDELYTTGNERVIHSILTVEHIMPQKWETHWALTNIPSLQTGNEFTAANSEKASEKRDNAIQTFGNLTLIVQPLNSSISNGKFADKKNKILEKSLLRLNRYLNGVDEWDEESILKRGKALFQTAKKIWAYPVKSQT